MTPHASQGTAFQEDRCADPWPIMDGKFSDVEDDAIGL
jgi:hypothetical protein